MEPALIPLRRTRLRLSRLGSWPLLAALALPLTAGAMLTPTVSQAAAVDSVPPAAFGTFWYVISVLGNRGGYSRQRQEKPQGSGIPVTGNIQPFIPNRPDRAFGELSRQPDAFFASHFFQSAGRERIANL